jgi:HEPN domain-containing protein
MKQTAVNWLIKQISSSKYFYNLMEEIESRNTIVQPNVLQQAKEMEKQQIIDAYRDGRSDQQSQREARWYNRNAEYYYNETHGGNK